VATGTGVVLALCILLYFTLRKINQPVDRLAHELRTPLTAISGYAEALMICRLTEEQRYNATRYILDESRRLAEVSEKLLTIANMRDRGLNRESVDIEGLFEHVQKTYGHVEYTAVWKRVTGDKVLLQSLINNLVANAIKASPEGSIVELISKDRQIIVRDHGVGMSGEQLEYVNHPDKKENPLKRSGLGIPLCHEIAKLHKATLHFTSEAGETLATVTFTTR
jgi:signal transduction histidine kinase